MYAQCGVCGWFCKQERDQVLGTKINCEGCGAIQVVNWVMGESSRGRAIGITALVVMILANMIALVAVIMGSMPVSVCFITLIVGGIGPMIVSPLAIVAGRRDNDNMSAVFGAAATLGGLFLLFVWPIVWVATNGF